MDPDDCAATSASAERKNDNVKKRIGIWRMMSGVSDSRGIQGGRVRWNAGSSDWRYTKPIYTRSKGACEAAITRYIKISSARRERSDSAHDAERTDSLKVLVKKGEEEKEASATREKGDEMKMAADPQHG